MEFSHKLDAYSSGIFTQLKEGRERLAARGVEVIDLGVDYDIIKKSGSWFSYGESKLAQGREAVKQLLTDNQELCDEIEAKIREVLATVQD